MTFSRRESRLFVAMCAFDVAKSISLFMLTARLSADPAEFWRRQLPDNMRMSTSLSDLLLIALLRVSLLCEICASSCSLPLCHTWPVCGRGGAWL